MEAFDIKDLGLRNYRRDSDTVFCEFMILEDILFGI